MAGITVRNLSDAYSWGAIVEGVNSDALADTGVRSLIIAPEGGRTGFIDGIALYRQFSPELRSRIERHNIVYKRDTRLSQLRFGLPDDLKVFQEPELQLKHAAEGAKHPRAIHPAV